MSVAAEIWLGHFALVADHIGTFEFGSLPRVEELVVVYINDERQVLEVKGITHEPTKVSDGIKEPVIRLRCIKAL